MKDNETDQARTLALAPRPPDMPVRVDTAMRAAAAEYEGAAARLAAYLSPTPRGRRLADV